MRPEGQKPLILLPGQAEPNPALESKPAGGALLLGLDEPKKLILPGDDGFFIPPDAKIHEQTRKAAFLDAALKSEPPANPNPITKTKLDKAAKDGVAVEAKTDQGTAFAVRVPSAFEPGQPIGVRVYRLDDSMSVEDGLKVAPKHDDDTMAIYVAASVDKPWSAIRNEVLGAIDQVADFDPDDYRVLDLDTKGSVQPSEAWLPAAFVRKRGEWKRVSPRADHKKELSTSEAQGKSAIVPKELARQPAEHGAFFATCIEDKTAFSDKRRMGVYFPPGYDETRTEPYPLLVLLPGSGSKIEHWTSYGRCIDQLDEVMKDGEKMIVVFPEVTGGGCADALAKSVLPHVLEHYHADESRMALGGISMGGDAALDIVTENLDQFASVSLHSAAIRSDNDVERFVARCHEAESTPRVWIDIGEHDKYSDLIDSASRLSALLDDVGLEHDFAVIDDHPSGAKHNWHFWASQLSKWIAFHQASFGAAGRTLDHKGVEVGTKHKRAAIEGDQKIWDELEASLDEFPALAEAATRAIDRAAGYEGPTVATRAEAIAEIVGRAASLHEEAKQIAARRDPEQPRVIPADGRAALRALSSNTNRVESFEKWLDELDAFASETTSTLGSLAGDFPSVHEALQRLADKNFETVWHPDGLTDTGLVDRIGRELGSGKFKRAGRAPAIAAYVDAVSSERSPFDSEPIAKLVKAHPTIVFQLMEAARRNRPVGLGSGSYFGKDPEYKVPDGLAAAFDGSPAEAIQRIERVLKALLLSIEPNAKGGGKKKKKKKKSEKVRLEAAADRMRSGLRIIEKKTEADARADW